MFVCTPDALARYVSFLDEHIAAGVSCGERTLIRGPLRIGAESRLQQASSRRCLGVDFPRPFLSTPSQACLRQEAVPPAEWLGDRGCCGDWLLLAGAAINNKFAYIGRAPFVKNHVRRSSLMRSIASEYGETVSKDQRRTELRVSILNHASTMFRPREPLRGKVSAQATELDHGVSGHPGDLHSRLVLARFQTITRNGRAMYISGIFCRAGLAIPQNACSRRAACVRGTSCGSIRR
jgi:hypothetical protein